MPESAPPAPRKWSVAHRGASAYAPEHTIESYRLAIEQGADFIEPDLQVTGDGVLVCLHDITLERTTDVAARFPERGRGEEVDGHSVRRWYVGDLSLEEIETLDAGSWFGDRFRGARVPTLAEALRLARGRVGVFPETKAPELYASLGVSMEALLLDTLAREGFGDPGSVVFQSFSAESLRVLGEEVPLIPSILLLEGPLDLSGMRSLASGIGPAKELILSDPALVQRAHEEGLVVIPWTFRSDQPGRFPDVRQEMSHFLNDLNVDGLFTNNPDLFPR